MSCKKGGRIIRGDDVRRFWSKTAPAAVGECVEWTATLTEHGYGKFMTGPSGTQTTWVAHRWSFRQTYGYLPDVVRHKCDNPKCVNSDHLEPGTQLDNVHDAMIRGRRIAIMTPDLVRHFRSVRATGASLMAEASRLEIPYSAAYAAAVGKTWRHI